MLGRIVRPADFERLLATPPKARSAHFAAHHVAGLPRTGRKTPADRPAAKLSTPDPHDCQQPVDDSGRIGPQGCWLGVTVPKRHAREATTRNLLRRQIRASVSASEPRLAPGLWLVRLRAPFDRRRFTSPTSSTLRAAARAELQQLLQKVCS